MKLKISDLKQNPFKKHINAGKLNENRIDVLIESINHGTLPEHFFVRQKNGEYQVTFGHHRLEALKRVKSDKHLVNCTIVKFSDEQMLIDMVRENITQRDTDFHDTREGIVLARNWLASHSEVVKQFNNFIDKHGEQGKRTDLGDNVPYRAIANFLSKNGKAVSYVTVKNYLDITDKLSPSLLEKVKKQDHATEQSGEKDKESIGVKDAIKISSITNNYDEQEDLVRALKNTREQHGNQKNLNLTSYKYATEEIKQQVRKGELDLADVEDETCKQELKETAEERPKTIFIPNFAQRMKDFDNNVKKLERQIGIFGKIFHSPEFKERYNTLRKGQKERLNTVVFDIRERIQNCQDEIDFFMKQLPDNVILLEVKE